MGQNIIAQLGQAITQLLSSQSSTLETTGLDIFRGLATILIVWFGIKSALSASQGLGGFHFAKFADLVLMIAFGLGSGLAALGGAVGAAMLPLEPYYPMKYLLLVLVVVALSGFGNMKASLGVAIFVGIVDTAGRLLVPEFGGFIIYLLLIVLMIWRQDGLFARRNA